MGLIYTDDLNKVEYKNLQKWIEGFIKKYRNDICEDEMMLVNLDSEKIENKITVMTDRSNNVWLFLYTKNKIISREFFHKGIVISIDIKFLKMLSHLKKSIR